MVLSVHIKQISPTETIPVRHAVLWPDLAPAEVVLDEDGAGIHFGAFLTPAEIEGSENKNEGSSAGAPGHAQPIAVISIFLKDWPSRPTSTDVLPLPSFNSIGVRFRKFACTSPNRSQGIGTQLLNHVTSFAREELKGDYLWCDARVETIGWYERRGMDREMNEEGKENVFMKKGKEYVRMRMELTLDRVHVERSRIGAD